MIDANEEKADLLRRIEAAYSIIHDEIWDGGIKNISPHNIVKMNLLMNEVVEMLKEHN